MAQLDRQVSQAPRAGLDKEVMTVVREKLERLELVEMMVLLDSLE